MVAECDELAGRRVPPGRAGHAVPRAARATAGRSATRGVAWSRSSVHTLGYDQFPATSLVRQLFEWDDLLAFLGDVLGRSPLYRYADPIGALNVAVMTEGDELGLALRPDRLRGVAGHPVERGRRRLRERRPPARPTTTSITTRSPRSSAGDDARPGRRRADDARHAHAVRGPALACIASRRSQGDRPRYVALFGYDTKPDTMSSELLKHVRYGRTEPLRAAG